MADFKTFSLPFDINTQSRTDSISAGVQFRSQDVGTAKLIFNIFKDGISLDLTDDTIKLNIRTADGSLFQLNGTVDDPENGVASCVLSNDVVTHYGTATAELVILYTENQSLSVSQFTFDIEQSIVDQDITPSATYYIQNLQDFMGAVNDILGPLTDNVNTQIDLINQNQVVKLPDYNADKADTAAQLADITQQKYSKIYSKLKGTTMYLPYNTSQYPSYQQIIDTAVADGCNLISICPRLNMDQTTSTMLTFLASDQDVINAFTYAKSKGLKTMLKCHIAGAGGGASANINPSDPRAWIQSLQSSVLYYCNLLGGNIDIVCLSNECTHQTNDNADLWQEFNAAVKAINSSYVTTTAATDVEMLTTVLYGIVDILGFNYYPKIGGYLSTPQQVRNRSMYNDTDGNDWMSIINQLSNQYGKPFMITETGCLPFEVSLKAPAKWDWNPPLTDENDQAQVAYFETVLPVFLNMSNIYGIVIWSATDGFSYVGKAAETIIKDYFGGDD